MNEIKAELMTPESFAEFGEILIPKKEMITFQNEKVSHFNAVCNLDEVGPDPAISFFRAVRREFLIDSLERHENTSEIFFPVKGVGLMPFAPSLENGEPDIDNSFYRHCIQSYK